MPTTERILYAVLNWGLGHATRSSVLIRRLCAEGHEVVLASDGAALDVLRTNHPDLRAIELPGYDVRYPGRGGSMARTMWTQIPRFKKVVRAEHRAIDRAIRDRPVDRIISDHRYGVHNARCRSIFMSHQLRLQVPWSRWIEDRVHRVHAASYAAFDEIWVPDHEPPDHLSGRLSRIRDQRVRFIGPLSRLRRTTTAVRYDVCVLLSGPEPQRSILADAVVDALRSTDLRVALVLGRPQARAPHAPDTWDVIDYLDADALSDVLSASRLLVSRSGYSTLMDRDVLDLPAIVIPTPGQTEQEYLARRAAKHRPTVDWMDQDDVADELARHVERSLGLRGLGA